MNKPIEMKLTPKIKNSIKLEIMKAYRKNQRANLTKSRKAVIKYNL